MREVVPGRLWLGNAADVRHCEQVLGAGILAVIDLVSEDAAPAFPRDILYCRFPVMDGEQACPGVVRTAVETVASLLRQEIPTLVFCGAGMSRSPAIVAAAIAIARGGSPDDRLREVVSGHPHDVSPQLWKEVRDVCVEMRQSP